MFFDANNPLPISFEFCISTHFDKPEFLSNLSFVKLLYLILIFFLLSSTTSHFFTNSDILILIFSFLANVKCVLLFKCNKQS